MRQGEFTKHATNAHHFVFLVVDMMIYSSFSDRIGSNSQDRQRVGRVSLPALLKKE
ncbi:MAG: hypothetical protein ACI8VY_000793, partial [Cellvibrionaceae bacterium]